MVDEIKKATLVKEGSDPRIVNVGSQEAQTAFSEGYTLPAVKTLEQAPVAKLEPVEPQILNREKIGQELTKSLDSGVGGQLANRAFIDASFRYKYGRDANEEDLENVRGKTVDQVAEMVKINDLATAYNMKPDKVEESPIAPKKLSFEDIQARATATGEEAKQADIEKYGLTDANLAANTVKGELDQMATDIDFGSLIDLKEAGLRADEYDADKLATEGRAVPMTFINREINKLSTEFNIEESQIKRAELFKNATNAYLYNTKLNQYNMLRGEAELAQQRVTESANDRKEYRQIAIENMSIQNEIDDREAKDLSDKNDRSWEKEVEGYMAIEPENYEAMVREYGENRIYTDAYGDSYLEPKMGIIPSSETETNVANISNADKIAIKNALLEQVGGDGYVSPNDYASAKEDWVSRGGTQASFDKEFDDRRNPANDGYNVAGKELDPPVYSKEWFNKVADVGYNSGLTTDDIYNRMIEGYSEEEIFNKAKEAGYASAWSGKEKDIKRYIESFRN